MKIIISPAKKMKSEPDPCAGKVDEKADVPGGEGAVEMQ